MSLLSTFSNKAPNKVFISISMGAVAGILYAFLIPLVMSSIAPKDARFGYEDDVKTLMFGIEVFNYKLVRTNWYGQDNGINQH